MDYKIMVVFCERNKTFTNLNSSKVSSSKLESEQEYYWEWGRPFSKRYFFTAGPKNCRMNQVLMIALYMSYKFSFRIFHDLNACEILEC